MKKLIAIFFFCLLGLHFAIPFSSFSQQSAICLDIEDDKNTEKCKDIVKEKVEKKEFENDRLQCLASLTQLILHNAAINFYLQYPITDIHTPPPDRC